MKTLSRISLKNQDREAIEAAAKRARALYPVELVILFGSKARGNDDAESDVDLLVLTARKLNWREEHSLTDAVFDIQLAYNVVISMLIMSSAEWSQGPYSVLPIHDEIERDGVIV